ncbi:hypothetical protein GIW81_00750 [Hyphomicrobium sp. xq]|uniref:Uncharacterized protein n=1 Tax=Hyphomicrobium album TaxID=2665159 RepID=A0A6I3KFB0_9HYPH|nr:hypothetical protein [Hyphomicrobium album]MTD92856.1 hypothetical protein [Hyphomicrobium album]
MANRYARKSAVRKPMSKTNASPPKIMLELDPGTAFSVKEAIDAQRELNMGLQEPSEPGDVLSEESRAYATLRERRLAKASKSLGKAATAHITAAVRLSPPRKKPR